MGFTSGAKIMAAIIDEIADGLIATAGGYWTNADANWTTADKTANNARRALKYTNGSEVIYLALEAINTGMNTYYDGSGHWAYTKGFRITFAASWDSVNHQPGSTTYRTFIQLEGRWYNANVDADLATLQVTYYLWVDASGFVITGKPEPNANDNEQGSFLAVVERNPNKEYSDGFSNFYGYFACSVENGTNTAEYQMRNFLRPFTYYNQDYNQQSWPGVEVNGIVFPRCPYYAFKSNGNGKVYYIKPIICNTADRKTPIFQSEMFFAYDEGQGLVDGDVIAIEGQTTKYLCKALDSPDSTQRLPFAMKYIA